MEIEKTLIQEQKLDRIANYAPYMHCVGFALLLALTYFKPINYSKYTQNLSYIFFFLTFLINRIYIYVGKDLEKDKKFSNKESKDRKKEYFMKFFAPIFFWTGCILLC